MENIVEKLNQYFVATDKQKVLKDWESIKDFDAIGPRMEDFLNYSTVNFQSKFVGSTIFKNIQLGNYSSEFSSSFFYN
ncbi:MAG: hypothetical protein LAT68_07910 [Cyclobacteriaceae bacterium]|nr:hypothetical protein [Cyclobacteriaceae bacterium]MCH8516238.1 hypothetical protein [Cyclobacteriaceae bacterium]